MDIGISIVERAIVKFWELLTPKRMTNQTQRYARGGY